MKTTAAVLHEVGKPLEIEELDLAAPGDHEVQVRWTHTGLCHSDLHIQQGDMGAWLPIVLGHEGAGVVEEVGPGVTRVKPGDHFVASFLPTCGTCHWCSIGRQNLCDMGAYTMRGHLPSGNWPLSGKAGRYGAMCMVGAFSTYGVVHESSTVRIDSDIPLQVAALVGCGVPTGWGSAVNSADVRPGDTVVIYGIGGIGINAVQGAHLAGARHVIAVDPTVLKRDTAMSLGATHAVATAEEALELSKQLTRGVGATSAIITVGNVTTNVVDAAFEVISKSGTVVITALAPFKDKTITLSGTEAVLWRKTVRGSLFGDCNPTTDIPRLLDLYRDGQLKLDELLTRTYTLDQINEGYEHLLAGELVRGVIVHEH
ncbi:alcohol dehydrogenase [Pseudonocardia sulfidoxydans NBRC 16205]|uniref:Alcohol dehydrogenase n=1 Tax=Pseudonocardia sulfidoxydans NBRC 16205 TaxID=1223511 RepID=A0A511DPG0_9PSEU|nr:Zn-dependent alcohol dehydrogenase [Pseudonocardia sulfidoxydans]GEL24938.1 alcohol dehydrogenase [Pseudonocardia sulfidoxydans NBRC 16205]